MAFLVTKANGSKQLFSREKIVQTCLRMGADSYIANEVAERIEKRLYEDITTQKILQLIFTYMRKYRPAVSHLFDLKRGISLMESKPEFELFIQVLLAHTGFEVTPNQILRGKCGEHEVDGIARKDGVTYFVEVKHHFNYHALTGLDESRIAWAVLEDVTDAFTLGLTDLKIDRAVIVTNTRYSEQAIQYGKCKNIIQIGWTSPEHFGLRDAIEKNKLYPLSCLRGVSVEERRRLVDSGIVLIKQLFDQDRLTIERKTGLPKATVLSIIEKAQHSANTLWDF
ncbi:MAG: restriction endonuclease [Candidatus Bathyarchaeia archaeon]